MPRCQKDGLWDPVQCTTGECWCVDVFGVEIEKTRGKYSEQFDCRQGMTFFGKCFSIESTTFISSCLIIARFELQQGRMTFAMESYVVLVAITDSPKIEMAVRIASAAILVKAL